MEEFVWNSRTNKYCFVSEPHPDSNKTTAEISEQLPISVTRSGIRIDFVAPISKTTQENKKNETFFVNTTPGVSQEREFKRLVRSQAMKAYHSKRRQKAASDANSKNVTIQPLLERGSLWCGRSVNTWTHDPFVRYPVDPDPASRELLHFVFTDKRASVTLFCQLYFPSGLVSPAAFYQTCKSFGRSASMMLKWLPSKWIVTRWPFHGATSQQGPKAHSSCTIVANMASWVRAITEKGNDLDQHMYSQQMRHTTKALNLTRTMLLDPQEQLSLGTIHAVTTLLHHASMNGDLIAAAYHLDGLEKLIKLRGGFQTLDFHAQAIVSSIETFLAATWDTKPRFVAPRNQYIVTTASDAQVNKGTISISTALLARSPTLQPQIGLLQECNRFINLLQREILSLKREVEASDANRLTSIWYRLLAEKVEQKSEPHIDTFEGVNEDERAMAKEKLDCEIIGEIIRLLCMIVSTTVWCFSNIVTTDIHITTLQLPTLRNLIQSHPDLSWHSLELLKAWAAVMGLLHSSDDDDVAFWLELWKKSVVELCDVQEDTEDASEIIVDASGVLGVPKVVKEVIWVEVLYGNRFRKLVESVHGDY